MSLVDRVTVTLPRELVAEIDRLEKNRSRFVLTAIEHELERRRREALRMSLENPHPETASLADAGFDEWATKLPADDVDGLFDPNAGKAIRWIPERGWVEVDE